MSQIQLKKVNWWHKSLVDWELANPHAKLNDCAEAFRMSASYLSIVRNSDVYIEYANERRAEHNALVSESVIEKVEKVAGLSLDVLNERIEKERDEIGLGMVKDTADLALKALGFGSRNNGGGGGGVQIIMGASPEAIERARTRMKTINANQSSETNEDIVIEQEALPAPN